VAALAFARNGQELLAVYGKKGVSYRWQIQSGTLLGAVNTGPVGVAAVSIDQAAKLLAVGAGKMEPAMQVGYDADFNGVRLWDAQSGKLILDTDAGLVYGLPVADVSLTPDGQWLAIARTAGLSVYEIATGKELLSAAIQSQSDDGNPAAITAITLDPTGNWLAYAHDGGQIILEERVTLTTEQGGKFDTYDNPRSIQIDSKEAPLALTFDPSRRYLVAATTESIIVWNLQSPFGNVVLEKSLSPSPLASLAFNRDGSLLAVGTASGWRIWSVNSWDLLVQNRQPSYAVTFGPDGRLFAWGDVDGIVHIWGIPAP
jgi:WD40 repeat protein